MVTALRNQLQKQLFSFKHITSIKVEQEVDEAKKIPVHSIKGKQLLSKVTYPTDRPIYLFDEKFSY